MYVFDISINVKKIYYLYINVNVFQVASHSSREVYEEI